MLKLVGTKIAVLSSAPRYDPQAKEFVSKLRQHSKEPLYIRGMIGRYHSKEFDYVDRSSYDMDNDELLPKRRFVTYQWVFKHSPITPYRMYTIYRQMRALSDLRSKGFFYKLVSYQYDAVVTVGCSTLALKIGKELNKVYKQYQRPKPFTALIDELISYRVLEEQEYFDFQYNRLARVPTFNEPYDFPSLCVGYERLYKAFQFLQRYKYDPTNDSFKLDPFTYSVHYLVQKAREHFRAKKDISDDAYIIYFDGGDFKADRYFALRKCVVGLMEWLYRPKVKIIDRKLLKVKTIETYDKEYNARVKEKISSLGLYIECYAAEDKYAVICASDYGVLHNGEATLEAAACQLPSLVLDNIPFYKVYFTHLYNGHSSPLNVSTNFHAYPDLIGEDSATPFLFANAIEESLFNSKIKFEYVKLYRNYIQRILSRSGTNPLLKVSLSGLSAGAYHLLQQTIIYKRLLGSKDIPSFHQRQLTWQ